MKRNFDHYNLLDANMLWKVQPEVILKILEECYMKVGDQFLVKVTGFMYIS